MLKIATGNFLTSQKRQYCVSLSDCRLQVYIPPFKFPHLPKQIQLKVLEFTALVNPCGLYCRGNQLECRGSCQVCGIVAKATKGERYLLKCFCARGHSAFNPRCYCENRMFQSSLFLVNRDFRNLATEFYYGRNQFEVSMGNGDVNPEQFSCAIPSCRWFPPGSIGSFTSSIINFDWFDVMNMDQNPYEWKNWEDQLKYSPNR